MIKKKISLFLLSILLSLIISNVAFAIDLEPSTQELTKQSNEEIKLGIQKEKREKALIQAINDFKENKITKDKLDSEVNNFNLIYTPKSSIYNSSLQSTSALASAVTTGCLNIPSTGQEKTWYCGPASAYNILKGDNITKNKNDQRPLTQYNLAVDLGATSAGAGWPGTWSATMSSWGPEYFAFVASSASQSGSLSTWKNNLYSHQKSDVLAAGIGVVYDTHQKPSDTTNRLTGYESISSHVWHYVAGDGYDETNPSAKRVHYSDSNKYRPAAWGSHWTTVQIMGNITWDRGMVW